MTIALCFHCGGTKFGALNPCASCQGGATGNLALDIAFSDHHLHVDTLKEFGAVLKVLRNASSNQDLCRWAFLHYVSTHHNSILSVALSPERAGDVEALLRRVILPEVTLRPGRRGSFST